MTQIQDYQEESIIQDLDSIADDVRCVIFSTESLQFYKHGVENYTARHDNNFITPNIISHFDFNFINHERVLRYRVSYLALQLGLKVVYDANRTTFDESYSHDHTPNIKFRCFYNTSDFMTISHKKKPISQQKVPMPNSCQFFISYKRMDPDDICSNYILDFYNPIHNHQINLELWNNRFEKLNYFMKY